MRTNGWKSLATLACLAAIGLVQVVIKKYLICQVTSQKQVIEISGNFISGSSSLYVTTLPRLVARGIVIVDVLSLPRDLARLPDERVICLYE